MIDGYDVNRLDRAPMLSLYSEIAGARPFDRGVTEHGRRRRSATVPRRVANLVEKRLHENVIMRRDALDRLRDRRCRTAGARACVS